MQKAVRDANPFTLAAALLGGVIFAAHIYFHLGDYTPERGFVAFVQIAAVSSAFGAMLLLVLETARLALEKTVARR